jgi:hypothetical protein
MTSSADNILFDVEQYEQKSASDGYTWETVTVPTSVTSTSRTPDRYLPPHKRGVREEMGDYFQVDMGTPDAQGVENARFKKLMIFLNYALTKAMVLALSARFPGCFFVSSDHHNHDHPIAHAVTHVGTRFMQRMIRAGSKVLDVYGNPFASRAFNKSQEKASNPKHCTALVNKSCPGDFIRAINKWGPWVDFENGGLMYHVGNIREQAREWLREFNVFQMVHTLYYVSPAEISHLLSARRDSKILALIHSHTQAHGFLNDGEQEYWVKGGIVKQRNVRTNSAYYHKDITPFWFREQKSFNVNDLPAGSNDGFGVSFTWELHFVCQDTWIVEIVPFFPDEIDVEAVDYRMLFEAAEEEERLSRKAHHVQSHNVVEPVRVLPTSDGKFLSLDVVNMELFSALRRKAAGRDRRGKRGQELMRDLLSSAKHLIQPGALFPGQDGLDCPDHLLFDHVVSAFVTDVCHETDVMKAVSFLHPVLEEHAKALHQGANFSKFTTFSLLSTVRAAVRGGIAANRIARSRDVVGSALEHIDSALDFE